MSLTHAVAVRTAVANLITAAINAGSVGPAGTLEFATSPAFTTILATLTFSATAFGAASNGIATANPIAPDTAADATGVCGAFRIKDRDGNEVLRGTVSPMGGGGDIQLSSVNISVGDTVSLTSLIYTACP